MTAPKKSLPPITLQADVPIYNGQAKADTVEFSDDDGTRAVALRVQGQRLYERLHLHRVITDHQRQAADQLRDLWERAGLDVGAASASDPRKPPNTHTHREIVNDGDAYAEYCVAVNSLPSVERQVVVRLVCHDDDVRVAMLMRGWRVGDLLRRGLDTLADGWGLGR